MERVMRHSSGKRSWPVLSPSSASREASFTQESSGAVPRGLILVSHVDDLLAGGPEGELKKLRTELAQNYEIKGNTLQESGGHLKFLGRSIVADEDGLVWTGDDKHRISLLEEWGMTASSPMDTPATSQEEPSVRETWEPMDHQEATKYRRAVAVINYMAQDRPDLSVAANYLSRRMASPRRGNDKQV